MKRWQKNLNLQKGQETLILGRTKEKKRGKKKKKNQDGTSIPEREL